MSKIFNLNDGRIKFDVGKHEGERLNRVVSEHGDYIDWFLNEGSLKDDDYMVLNMASEGFSEKKILETLKVPRSDKKQWPVDEVTGRYVKRVERAE